MFAGRNPAQVRGLEHMVQIGDFVLSGRMQKADEFLTARSQRVKKPAQRPRGDDLAARKAMGWDMVVKS
jgi:hypothetical protein